MVVEHVVHARIDVNGGGVLIESDTGEIHVSPAARELLEQLPESDLQSLALPRSQPGEQIGGDLGCVERGEPLEVAEHGGVRGMEAHQQGELLERLVEEPE